MMYFKDLKLFIYIYIYNNYTLIYIFVNQSNVAFPHFQMAAS